MVAARRFQQIIIIAPVSQAQILLSRAMYLCAELAFYRPFVVRSIK